ncbi:MAG: hypothetical protein KIH01_08645, partial [Candidatus Freyarchaeota archaeon]|nr:hypothetical protein [Candidatus Jordarchaeia archaeon]
AVARIKDSVERALREVGGEWTPPTPPKRKAERKKLPEERVEEVKEEASGIAEEEVRGGGGSEGEGGKVSGETLSPEEAIAKIQRIQKYLQSLHEYYSLGKMTEEEYTFLKRKAFRKIEELKRLLQGGEGGMP